MAKLRAGAGERAIREATWKICDSRSRKRTYCFRQSREDDDNCLCRSLSDEMAFSRATIWTDREERGAWLRSVGERCAAWKPMGASATGCGLSDPKSKANAADWGRDGELCVIT